MFYIKAIDKANNICSIMDTDDYVIESYSIEDTLKISKDVKILGVENNEVGVFSFDNYAKFIMARDRLNGIKSNYGLNGLGAFCLFDLDLGDKTHYDVPDGVYAVATFYTNSEPEEGDSEIKSKFPFSIHLPKSCRVIYRNSFSGSKIERINLNYVHQIEEYAFSGCSHLRVVDLRRKPDYKPYEIHDTTGYNMNKLHKGCFINSGVEKVHLGDISYLEGNCFYGCENLKEVVALSLSNVEGDNFGNCRSLRSITVSGESAESGLFYYSHFEDNVVIKYQDK